MIHVISSNYNDHLHCLQCWCNPIETTVEGETYILHNSNYTGYERRTTEVQISMRESGDAKEDI